MSSPRVLGVAGSLRRASYNRQVVHIACEAARREGARVTEIDLADHPIPIFDEDLERREGPDEHVLALKRAFIEADGLIIGSPEYNSSITAVLKNVIDWVSRAAPGEKSLAAFSGKAVVVVSASPGKFGGYRSLSTTRSILSQLDAILLPQTVAVASAHQAFTDEGRLRDDGLMARTEAVGTDLVRFLKHTSDDAAS